MTARADSVRLMSSLLCGLDICILFLFLFPLLGGLLTSHEQGVCVLSKGRLLRVVTVQFYIIRPHYIWRELWRKSDFKLFFLEQMGLDGRNHQYIGTII